MTVITLTMDIAINDLRAAYREARAMILADLSAEGIRRQLAQAMNLLRYDDGRMNPGAIVLMLYDAGVSHDGTEIIESRTDS